jgi:hypothetical protein
MTLNQRNGLAIANGVSCEELAAEQGEDRCERREGIGEYMKVSRAKVQVMVVIVTMIAVSVRMIA